VSTKDQGLVRLLFLLLFVLFLLDGTNDMDDFQRAFTSVPAHLRYKLAAVSFLAPVGLYLGMAWRDHLEFGKVRAPTRLATLLAHCVVREDFIQLIFTKFASGFEFNLLVCSCTQQQRAELKKIYDEELEKQVREQVYRARGLEPPTYTTEPPK
jgi:hypothetical protein